MDESNGAFRNSESLFTVSKRYDRNFAYRKSLDSDRDIEVRIMNHLM